MAALEKAQFIGNTAPLINQTIGAYLDDIAADHADDEAIVMPHQNIRWSYRRVNE